VVRDGHTSTVQVRLGVAGTALTEVTSGLKDGDRVVLADYSKSVPASTNATTSTGGGFARLFNGGGGAFPAFPGSR
jgi:ABC-type hemin transport system substrate-binding protein